MMTVAEPADQHEETMRLQRFLARAGVDSRRRCETIITDGRVTVNGTVVTELGSRVDPCGDVVKVDGAVVRLPEGFAYLMLNKPAGYVTTMDDPHAEHTVAELVPVDRYPGLFPVGRLDADTTGLLLFTSDGELNQRLLHPSHHVEKTYLALVAGTLTRAEAGRLRRGIELDGVMTKPARLEQLEEERFRDPRRLSRIVRGRWERLSISEGRTHQVKNMFKAVGHPVARLHRSAFGPLDLGDLEEGCWRELTPAEVDALRRAAYEEK